MPRLDEVMDDLNGHIVTKINGRDVTRGELAKAFGLVQDKANWKNPISTTIHANVETLLMVRDAVTFFTGSEPTFTRIKGGKFRVKADGYYAAVGA